MPFEVGTFQDGEIELAYEVHGSGRRVVVYMHGLLMDTHLNRRLADDIAAHGYKVILVDLPGHGASGKPRHASAHRIDAYAQHVIRLMDALDVERAVVGGMSLGANVSLEVALVAPDRLRGMIVEMPVLENATPVAALLFVPLLLAAHYSAPLLRRVTSALTRLPRQWLGPVSQYVAPLMLQPEEMAAVLHGMLVGPVAPTAEQRASFGVPALVIGHRSDRLHPFADASNLAAQLPRARLVEARSILELRHHPQRLTTEIVTFLDSCWPEPRRQRSSASA